MNFFLEYKEVNKCLNENECQDRFVNCPERSFCVDTLGSYKCVCRDGFFDSNESNKSDNVGRDSGFNSLIFKILQPGMKRIRHV